MTTREEGHQDWGLLSMVCMSIGSQMTPVKNYLVSQKHVWSFYFTVFNSLLNSHLAFDLISRKSEKPHEVGKYYLLYRQVIWRMQFLSNDSEQVRGTAWLLIQPP